MKDLIYSWNSVLLLAEDLTGTKTCSFFVKGSPAFLGSGGVSVAHCELNADGKFMPLPGEFWWAALQAAEKWISRSIEDLGKLAFGLWGCIQPAAWTPSVWQGQTLQEITPWLKYLCSLQDLSLPESDLPLSWEVFLSSAFKGFSPHVFRAWNNFLSQRNKRSQWRYSDWDEELGRKGSLITEEDLSKM